jgi:signal transduction histidine kinase
MESSIHKLDDTLKEILEYSRNARKELTVDEIDVSKIISDNLERMQYMPGSGLIRKDVNVNIAAPLFSDSYRVGVIFNNLISNAIKYSDPHKEDPFIRIDINVDEKRAVFVVEDNGIGIAREYIARVFDMFFRATTQKDGAGLGLYIVKEAVDKLHGTISIDSEPRVSTRFRIELPNLKTFTPTPSED